MAGVGLLLCLAVAAIVTQQPGSRPPAAPAAAAQNPPAELAPPVTPTTGATGSGDVVTPAARLATIPISDDPVPILMYHYIRPDPGPDDPVGQGLSVSPELFAAQMAYLAEQGFSTLTMAELVDVWQGHRPLPARPVVLTFDDGYRDFFTDAWPILQQYGFSATVYMVTSLVDEPAYLTSEMIRELDASGSVDFGAHTVYHSDLPNLTDADAEAEITGSKLALEALLGHPVRTFSYPAGHYSDRDLALVDAAGYELAVTTEWAVAARGMDHRLLPRLRVSGWTTVEELAGWL
jgi:peptidoglycan/xylan/chitin deacetylase (PgdA/CDA1 family)